MKSGCSLKLLATHVWNQITLSSNRIEKKYCENSFTCDTHAQHYLSLILRTFTACRGGMAEGHLVCYNLPPVDPCYPHTAGLGVHQSCLAAVVEALAVVGPEAVGTRPDSLEEHCIHHLDLSNTKREATLKLGPTDWTVSWFAVFSSYLISNCHCQLWNGENIIFKGKNGALSLNITGLLVHTLLSQHNGAR